ncbi:coiled-coil-helix-coiled-coil-helix domain-containing protein 7-like [Centruroides sculpturatus]|uniref:coiled-coil-helix-coiled-coil-helix domain-containing protein 7-like n=1 Tax=Centruroides sculpturatus TaxID=218467 RepID=UPI000C6DC405|nr:coiled-coil-helix-coiled-coil-helix domain-containing protein 7-like [Centruroides sculpturatus]
MYCTLERQHEHDLSLNCLEQNNYNKNKCQLHFENYINCKKFWSLVVSDRKKKGMKPYLPSVQDRGKIKEEYKQCFSYVKKKKTGLTFYYPPEKVDIVIKKLELLKMLCGH